MVLEVDRLTKRLGAVTVLQQISFRLGRAEVLGVIGPNGAGKTTLLRILAGCLWPSAGTVQVCGLDMVRDGHRARRKIGYLPEKVTLYPSMTVSSCLSFFAGAKGVQARELEVREVVEICGLAGKEHTAVQTLSQGYQRRVGLAQALLGSPELLLLDEPFSHLDPSQVEELRETLTKRQERTAVVISAHDLSTLSPLCTRAAFLKGGELVVQGQ